MDRVLWHFTKPVFYCFTQPDSSVTESSLPCIMSAIYILHGQYLALIHSHLKLQFFDWASKYILYKGSLGTPEKGCPTQCLLDSQIQIKGSWVELHFSVVIHALSNWLRYQVSYQLKNRCKVFFSAEKNFLFLSILFFFSFRYFCSSPTTWPGWTTSPVPWTSPLSSWRRCSSLRRWYTT